MYLAEFNWQKCLPNTKILQFLSALKTVDKFGWQLHVERFKEYLVGFGDFKSHLLMRAGKTNEILTCLRSQHLKY